MWYIYQSRGRRGGSVVIIIDNPSFAFANLSLSLGFVVFSFFAQL